MFKNEFKPKQTNIQIYFTIVVLVYMINETDY